MIIGKEALELSTASNATSEKGYLADHYPLVRLSTSVGEGLFRFDNLGTGTAIVYEVRFGLEHLNDFPSGFPPDEQNKFVSDYFRDVVSREFPNLGGVVNDLIPSNTMHTPTTIIAAGGQHDLLRYDFANLTRYAVQHPTKGLASEADAEQIKRAVILRAKILICYTDPTSWITGNVTRNVTNDDDAECSNPPPPLIQAPANR